ncbi:MAG: endonuclease/exonuclease/phosphatase family protein [Neisseriaceae bacterium]
MKIISLNMWSGHVGKPLFDFINSCREIDIFCFQEVYYNAERKISTDDKEVNLNLFSELQLLLPNHQGLFRPVVDNIYGICMFVNKKIKIIGEGEVNIYNNPNYIGNGPTHSRNLQWLDFCYGDKNYFIMNIHGLWNGMGKTDTVIRINQANIIKNFMKTINKPKVICGDFNLRPDTKSIEIIGEGMKDLIDLYKIKSTRTKFYEKDEKFADYIFISPEIIVNDFKVLSDEVSDHAPLYLDFI